MKTVQYPRGTTTWNMAQTLPTSAITFDTDLNKLRVHDGVTPGGHLLYREEDLVTAAAYRFIAKNTKSIPATGWTVADLNDLNEITVAGNYTLMDSAVASIGQPVLVKALVAGAALYGLGGDQINDHGVDAGHINLTQYEVVTLVKQSAGSWLVLARY